MANFAFSDTNCTNSHFSYAEMKPDGGATCLPTRGSSVNHTMIAHRGKATDMEEIRMKRDIEKKHGAGLSALSSLRLFFLFFSSFR